MFNLGISTAAKRAVITALLSTNSVKIRIEMMDLNHNHILNMSPYFIDGQIDIDLDGQTTTRQASLTFSDPNRNLPFDSDSPAATALWLDRMVRIYYEVVVNGDYTSVPVFTGPLATNLVRNGDLVTVTCYDKAWLAMGAAWHPTMYHKLQPKTTAIKNIMMDLAGEFSNYIDVGDLSYKLTKDYPVHRYTAPWAAASHLAHSMNRQLYYDAMGHLKLRSYPGNSLFSFSDANSVTGRLNITYSGDVVNTVEVIGATPKGSKTPISSVAVAPRDHPLSPQRLGRNGVARHLLKDGQATTNDSIKKQSDADDLANRLLKDALVQQVNAEFQCLPGAVVLLDPADLCHVSGDDGSVTFRLRKFSLPLKAGEAASVGYFKNMNVARTRRRHTAAPKRR